MLEGRPKAGGWVVRSLFDSVSDLPRLILGLPPEHQERLTFHLPLEIQALEVAGAAEDVVRDRIEQRLPPAFRNSLVDPPLFRWAESHYMDVAERLCSSDQETRRRAFSEVSALGAGLAGGAFHPLIRFGYGVLRSDPHEIARGLAYLRVRRQVLFPGHAPSLHPTDLAMPTPQELEGTSVFDQLDLVAGEQALFHHEDQSSELAPVTELCKRACELVNHDPASFIAVHTVTGLHGLVEVDRLVSGRRDAGDSPDDPLMANWWRAMSDAITASSILVKASPPAPRARPVVSQRHMESLVSASVESCEVHDLKISVSLARLVELGVTTEQEALATGAAKLSATECTA